MESMKKEPGEALAGNVCPGCGKRFQCGAEAGLKTCWCMERPPLPAGSAAASAAGAHCFCPDCLDKRRQELT